MCETHRAATLKSRTFDLYYYFIHNVRGTMRRSSCRYRLGNTRRIVESYIGVLLCAREYTYKYVRTRNRPDVVDIKTRLGARGRFYKRVRRPDNRRDSTGRSRVRDYIIKKPPQKKKKDNDFVLNTV